MLRGIAAAATRKKLLHFRYRPADAAWWQEMHGLISAAGRLGIANEAALPFDGCEKKYTALQLYLVAAYFELAPLSNLVPQQVEVIDRLLLDGADTLELAGSAGCGLDPPIDLGGDHGPLPLVRDAPPARARSATCRAARLRSLVTKLAAELRKSRDVPEALHASGIDIEQVRQLVTVLMQHWAEPPPQRGTARQSTARRTARRARLRAGTAHDRLYRFRPLRPLARVQRRRHQRPVPGASLRQPRSPTKLPRCDGTGHARTSRWWSNPLAVLEKLELSGDRQMMEHWVQADISDTGLGAVAPAVRAKHRIGGLVCLRYADGIEWHLGLIRRIGRDAAGQATLGIETLAWPSASARSSRWWIEAVARLGQARRRAAMAILMLFSWPMTATN